jgi:hypothetical protein
VQILVVTATGKQSNGALIGFPANSLQLKRTGRWFTFSSAQKDTSVQNNVRWIQHYLFCVMVIWLDELVSP